MTSKTSKTMVRAFFEIPGPDPENPRIASRQQVLENSRMLAAVESEMRRKLLDIVGDVEGLGLHRDDPWWMVVREAAREKRRAPVPK